MNEHDKEREFLVSAKTLLDESVEDIDGPTQTRLKMARRQALDSPQSTVPRFLWAGGVVSAAVVLLITGLWLFQPHSSGPLPSFEDMEILASSEEPDFYDDLDFYHWLAHADRAS